MIEQKKMRFYRLRDLDKGKIPQLEKVSDEDYLCDKSCFSKVLPFRTNNYVVEELIDWDNVPNISYVPVNFSAERYVD
ncbi:MAG: hypothetical protein U5K00_02025 [Melioribacteraceae bacterium]|nr:hypothetical protein [Melioribacteraceae bacterium]